MGIPTAVSTSNPLQELHKYGQSVWLDYIRRSLITSGELKRLIEQDGLRRRDVQSRRFSKRPSPAAPITPTHCSSCKSAKTWMPMAHLREPRHSRHPGRRRHAAARVRAHQEARRLRQPGVSPFLAHDTEGTIEEARRLWKAVNRPNLMVKVPGTTEGIPAFQQLISEGINVNVTLLFSQSVYEQVADAYIAGLKKARRRWRSRATSPASPASSSAASTAWWTPY